MSAPSSCTWMSEFAGRTRHTVRADRNRSTIHISATLSLQDCDGKFTEYESRELILAIKAAVVWLHDMNLVSTTELSGEGD